MEHLVQTETLPTMKLAAVLLGAAVILLVSGEF